jgi:hypothetical protein
MENDCCQRQGFERLEYRLQNSGLRLLGDGCHYGRMVYVDDSADTRGTFTELLNLERAIGTPALLAGKRCSSCKLRLRWISSCPTWACPKWTGMSRSPNRAESVQRPGLAIVLTGCGRQQNMKRTVDAGFDAHINKPVKTRMLEDAVHTLMLAA